MKKNMFAAVLVVFPLILTNAQPLSGPFPVPPGTNTSVGFANQTTNIEGSFFHLNQTIGSTNGLLRINSTNIIGNPGALHLTETAGSPYLFSTDSCFAGLRPGFQIENNGGGFGQLMLTKIISPTSAVAVAINTGFISLPGETVNNSTNFNIRPPNMVWSDDAIGFEQNGGFQDNNGMNWVTMIDDQGCYYFYDPSTGNAVSMGIANGTSIGVSSGELVWNISSLRTNAGSGGNSPNNIFNVVGNAPAETMTIMSNGVIAIGDGVGRMGSGFTNRHPNVVGNHIPFWVGVLITNIQNSSFVEFTNGNIKFSGTITGNGNNLTNVATGYTTNITATITNVNLTQQIQSWKIPAMVTEPAATLGNAEIDAQVQRADGVWVIMDKLDIAGGVTSILQTNKQNLIFDVYPGQSWRLTNSVAGTGYTAGLDPGLTVTNQVLFH